MNNLGEEHSGGSMMSTSTTEADLDKRLNAVERTVASILMRMQKSEPTLGWLKQFRGCMADEPGFKDLVRYGREIRQADRPAGDDSPS
jgi:hypothetical protein